MLNLVQDPQRITGLGKVRSRRTWVEIPWMLYTFAEVILRPVVPSTFQPRFVVRNDLASLSNGQNFSKRSARMSDLPLFLATSYC